MEELMTKFNQYIDSNQMKKIKDKDINRYFQIKSSIHVLNYTDDIVNEYLNNKYSLIDTYGLFQYMFISIDALYDLAHAIVNNKWTININTNPRLRDIKYIRNDCVGHPTYRQYGSKKVGFCYIDAKNTTKDLLIYDCYLENINDVVRKQFDVSDLIKNFQEELNETLDEIYSYVQAKKENKTIFLSPLVISLYEEYLKGSLSYQILDKLKDEYILAFNLKQNSKNRFLWRLHIIKQLSKVVVNNQLEEEAINYLINKQINKVYNMSLEIDRKKYQVAPPIYKMNYKEGTMIKYAKNYFNGKQCREILNDSNHPLFDKVIEREIKKAPKIVSDLLVMMKREEQNQEFIFALGNEICNE